MSSPGAGSEDLEARVAALEAEVEDAWGRYWLLRRRRIVRAALGLAAFVGRLRGLRPDPTPAGPTPAAPVQDAGREPVAEPAPAQPPPVAQMFEPGHFYSPVPDTRTLAQEPARSRVWPQTPREMPGVSWREDAQLELLSRLGAQEPRDGWYTENPNFSFLDSWMLQALLRHAEPRRVIEVGSGWSSLVTAWVNREIFGSRIDVTCIEPYPPDVLADGPVDGISRLEVTPVQDVPLARFEALEEDDVLFIDTGHVVKTGGDVTFLLHEVVPRLRQGVLVHIHDVFLPRDYPEDWVLGGRGWNEQYLVQSFLAFNADFEVLLASAWLWHDHQAALADAIPGFAQAPRDGGGSLWLRRRM